jgi:HlyD family secretion protein
MKRTWIIAIVIAFAAIAAFLLLKNGKNSAEIEYRYATVEQGELIRSTSATGVLVALTTVDVKSKAGGKVVKLAVDEGSVVKQGDLVAMIDPDDTQAAYEQANASLEASMARSRQAQINYALQRAKTSTSIADAQASLDAANIRLQKARMQAERQPALSKSALESAQAAYDTAVEDQRTLVNITIPQQRRDTVGSLNKAQADFNSAKAALSRQKQLLAKGYVSQASVDSAEASFESARASYDTAKQKNETLEQDIAQKRKNQELLVKRAQAALSQAQTNMSDVDISKNSLREAAKAVVTAKIALQQAKDDARNDLVKKDEVKAVEAGTVRDRVSKDNAKVQLDSTTVVAPRDGVVTLKYLEEGTIIPPGTSTFSQGTSLVQISDVTRMFVDCTVDEADISMIRSAMPVRIILEAYPGETLNGKVIRISPSAKTDQNITSVKVRVEIEKGGKTQLLPGMNATCEFILKAKKDVLILPSQAIQRENGKTFVKVKTKDPLKPEKREVKLGDEGNDGSEVVSGLKAGEEVVIAEINMKDMLETQKKMEESQQSGGLAGGTGPRRPAARAGTSRGRSK